jgi:catechol 2,3-dioxygenase-like lactoylglutathione lyase family enzyme
MPNALKAPGANTQERIADAGVTVIAASALPHGARLESIDVVRGVIMIIMALDHTREFSGVPGQNPTDLASTTAALFLTRWVTFFCAPVFFLLTGAGAFLSLRRRPPADLARFLLTRGLWLIFLELVLVRCLVYQFNVDYRVTMLLVLWALGWAMITLAVQSPGIYVLLRKQDYSRGTVGSTINHFGFYVKDFAASVARWKAAGLNWEPVKNPTVGQGFLMGPDNVRIEIYENKSIAAAVEMHHIHMMVPDPLAAQKWYVEHFGATAGKRGQIDTAKVPGAELSLSKADAPLSPTQGRSLDHIGFEVKSIDAFVARLQTAGIKTDAAIGNSTNASGLRIADITDPWGTEIELTEGLGATPAASR